MADVTDFFTHWVSYDSETCSDHQWIHVGPCMSHYFDRDNFREIHYDVMGYITHARQWMLTTPYKEVRNAMCNAMVALSSAQGLLMWAITDCRKLIEELGPPEVEPGATLLNVLKDLTGEP